MQRVPWGPLCCGGGFRERTVAPTVRRHVHRGKGKRTQAPLRSLFCSGVAEARFLAPWPRQNGLLREVDDLRCMSGCFEKAEEVVGVDPGGLGVVERVEVESIAVEQSAVEEHPNLVGVVVDCGEG